MKDNKMDKKIIVVSGASSGIGLSICHAFSEQYEVIGVGRRELEGKLSFNYFSGIDVANKSDIKKVSKMIDISRVYGVIACAGIASMNHFFLMPESTRRKLMDVNFHGAVNLIETFVKPMIKAKRGRIIGVSTIAVPLMLEGEAAYAASKAALETYIKVISNEVAEWNITANTIRPSATETFLLAGLDKDQVDGVLNRQTIKRKLNMDEIVSLVEYLISDQASAITGQSVTLGLSS